MIVVNNGDGDMTIYLESTKDREILKAVCAFLNLYEGGEVKVHLSIEVSSTLDSKAIDNVKRQFEQKLSEFFGMEIQTKRLSVSVNTFNHVHELVCTVRSRSNISRPWNLRYRQFPFVLDYHYYLSVGTQIRVVKPTKFAPNELGHLFYPGEGLFERGKDEEYPTHNTTTVEGLEKQNNPTFIRGKVPEGCQESNTMQFKLLDDTPSKNKKTTLADRIVTESNKLQKTTSGFANSKGGKLFYGIVDKTGQVQGQKVGEEEKRKIKQKVDSALSKMIWPKTNTSETDRPWKIDFEPVHDKDGDVIPETYVIVISVAKCPGGVFVKAPESYHIVNGKVVAMSFDEFKAKALAYTRKLSVL